MEAVWRLLPGQRLHSRTWEDESVVFNDLSGDTHLLGASALHLLHTLRAGAADLPALTATLQAEFDIDPDDDPATLVAELLDELRALALIDTAP